MTEHDSRPSADARTELRADCSRCQGLCCVAPAFARSQDFAIDKPPGRPCPHLTAADSCGIHSELRQHGFPGCTVFDCFGAGQQVVQQTFRNQHWRESKATAASMFAVFEVMRQLKQSLWYLVEALTLLPAGQLRDQLEQAQGSIRRLVELPAPEFEQLDPASHRAELGPLLARVSVSLRAGVVDRGPDRIGADLIGAKLSGAKLDGVSLRGAYLLGADLRSASLRRTDLLGADLRGADLRGARMSETLFLTQPQLDSASGDSATTLPSWLTRPRHWTGGGGTDAG